MTEKGVATIRITVSGSFTKHWDAVQAAVKEFRELGTSILSPLNGPPVREENGFVYLRGDVGSPDLIEQNHLRAIQQSDLLYIVNPGGYLGSSVLMEMGYALASGTAMWSQEPISDHPHRLLVHSGSVSDAVTSVRRSLGDTELPAEGRVDELQRYIQQISNVRGFSEESPQDVLILLMEEVGELAKAVRARLNLAMSSSDTSSKNIRLELADCFIYILHFANQTGVNLLSAFKEKERLNAGKKWSRR